MILCIHILYKIRAVGDAILFPVATVGGRSSLPDAVIGSISFGRFVQQGCDLRHASAASPRSPCTIMYDIKYMYKTVRRDRYTLVILPI